MSKVGLVYLRIIVFVLITVLYAAQIPNNNVLANIEVLEQEVEPKPQVTANVIEIAEPPKPANPETKEIGYAEVPNSNDNSGKNAVLSARLTNDVIIEPGEIYSFNQVVGIRTPSRGFVDGQTVVNTTYGSEYVPGIGGGICRTSTAIHHAVLAAGIEVVERHSHSLPVSYSELGRDAAVAYGSLDYRFKNNTENPIKVVVDADNTRIAVKLLTLSEAKERID